MKLRITVELEIDEERLKEHCGNMAAKCSMSKEDAVSLTKTIFRMARHWYPFIHLRKCRAA